MTIPEKSIQHCCLKSKKSGSTFHPAFWFLPPQQRKALHVIYYFCRLVDDAVDENTDNARAAQELELLRQGLEGKQNAPVWEALLWVIEHYQIPKKYPLDLIKGAETDIGAVRIRDISALDLYCYRVAGTVGLMTLHLFKAPVEAVKESALSLARAYQYTNILRDVAEDHARNRCYIPLDLLEKHNVYQDWKKRKNSPKFQAVLEKLAERAETEYKEGVTVLKTVAPRQRFTLALMTAAYSGYLAALKKSGFSVWEFRPRYKKYHLPGLMLKALQGTLFSPEKCLRT
ncbi:MAG: phytoene/squalene synthase family protein [bacterium]